MKFRWALLPGLAQQGQSLLLQVRALAVLRADVQQAHPGLLHPHEPLGVKAAQIGELQQVLRGAVGVGAAVAENGMASGGGEYRPHGRPANAPDPLHQQGGPRQQRAGGAGGDGAAGGGFFTKDDSVRFYDPLLMRFTTPLRLSVSENKMD